MSSTDALTLFLVLIIILFIIAATIIAIGFQRAGWGGSGRAVISSTPRKPPASERDPQSLAERPDAHTGAGLANDGEREPSS